MIAAGLAFAAAALAVVGLALLAPRRPFRPATERLMSPGTSQSLSRSVGAVRLLARIGRGAARRAAPPELERRIEAAGRPGAVTARELMAAKLAGAVAVAALALPVGAAAPGRLGVLVLLAAPVAGFLAPDLWLRRVAGRRATAVRRELPQLLELLRVTVEAGASLGAALGAVGARTGGPLAAEWRAVAGQVELGVPLAAALERMTWRLPLPEVHALVAALDRARRHGAPLGATLAGQARDARLALRHRVQEDAARAGPKIQLVVALLLVPSVLLLVAAALASALLGSGGGAPLP